MQLIYINQLDFYLSSEGKYLQNSSVNENTWITFGYGLLVV